MGRRDYAAGLVKQIIFRLLALQRYPINRYLITGADLSAQFGDQLAVDLDVTFDDQFFRRPPTGYPSFSHCFLESFHLHFLTIPFSFVVTAELLKRYHHPDLLAVDSYQVLAARLKSSAQSSPKRPAS